MAFCKSCGHELADGSRFCHKCGQKVSKAIQTNEIKTETRRFYRNIRSNDTDIDVNIPIEIIRDNTSQDQHQTVFIAHLNRYVKFRIPPDVYLDQKIRLHGLGKEKDGKQGDVYLQVTRIHNRTEYEYKEPETRETYDGCVHKCPNCGDIIDAYETVCDACGFELRGRKRTSVVHELSLKLEQTNDADRKDELIRTFYIPNTKEDIHEFFILAMSNIKVGGTNTNAWMVKLEQAYQKAELSFSGTQEFERLKALYDKAQSMNRTNKTIGIIKSVGRCFKSGYAWALLFATIGGCMWAISGDFESTTSIVGMFGVVGGAYIAMMTMVNNDGKKKK